MEISRGYVVVDYSLKYSSAAIVALNKFWPYYIEWGYPMLPLGLNGLFEFTPLCKA